MSMNRYVWTVIYHLLGLLFSINQCITAWFFRWDGPSPILYDDNKLPLHVCQYLYIVHLVYIFVITLICVRSWIVSLPFALFGAIVCQVAWAYSYSILLGESMWGFP
jgi:hypothetical protein